MWWLSVQLTSESGATLTTYCGRCSDRSEAVGTLKRLLRQFGHIIGHVAMNPLEIAPEAVCTWGHEYLRLEDHIREIRMAKEDKDVNLIEG